MHLDKNILNMHQVNINSKKILYTCIECVSFMFLIYTQFYKHLNYIPVYIT